MKIGMAALGCAKNRVDSEIIIKKLEDRGHEICYDMNLCDVIIIHTCSFIETAKNESIETILNLSQAKKTGQCKKIIVSGCMAEMYKEQILKEIPEVDTVIGAKSFDRICEAIENDTNMIFTPLDCPTPEGERHLTTPSYSVYLKIADGCSHHCSYCVIPLVRGEFMPRTRESIVDEAVLLAKNGAKEINLIAQDTTRHPEICNIIKDICAIPSVVWVRLLYCRPEGLTKELIKTIASEEKCVNYIDLPLQHASQRILSKMNRSAGTSLTELISYIRSQLKAVSLRTTFITGFPSESEEDFEILCEFIKEIRFNNLGVFPYSREEGTKAARMHNQIDTEIKEKRAEIIMTIQKTLLEDIKNDFIGNTYDVLCEGKSGKYFTGRAYFQAPEVDGLIYFTSKHDIKPGCFVKVTINNYKNYDFYGTEIRKN